MGKFSDKLDKVFPVDDEKGRKELQSKWEERKGKGSCRKKNKFRGHDRDNDDDGDDD